MEEACEGRLQRTLVVVLALAISGCVPTGGSPSVSPSTHATQVSSPTTPPPGTWSSAAALPSVPTQWIADTVVIGPSTILVFLVGDPGLPILAYDTAADAWSELRPLVTNPIVIGTDDVFEQAKDGWIYRFSGATWTEIQRYDPTTNAWDPEWAATLEDSFVSDAVSLEDGSILLLSPGVAPTTCLRSFDPTTRAASPVRCEPGGYWRGLARIRDGTILAFGESGVARYDPSSDTWEPFDPPPSDLSGAGMGVGPDGRVYAFGGPLDSAPIALVYDPHASRWLSVPLPSIARHRPEVVPGPNGRLYLIGGISASLTDPYSPPMERSVEVFTPPV